MMSEKIRVIYEDKNFLALYKPAGTLVHAVELKASAKGGSVSGGKSSKLKVEPTLVDWLVKIIPK